MGVSPDLSKNPEGKILLKEVELIRRETQSERWIKTALCCCWCFCSEFFNSVIQTFISLEGQLKLSHSISSDFLDELIFSKSKVRSWRGEESLVSLWRASMLLFWLCVGVGCVCEESNCCTDCRPRKRLQVTHKWNTFT